jgi:hypothetical protein
MKKVVGFFFILILAAVAFFFGWTQLPVPPGAYGVLRSKTHGVDTAVIREGEFRWVWYKLIPTNAATLVFTLNPVTRPIHVTGDLPSARTYATAAGISADFSYEISGNISFTLKPGSLPALTLKELLTDQESLEEYERTLAGEIESYAIGRLEVYSSEGNAPGEAGSGSREKINFDEGRQTATAARLTEDILGEFPDIERLSCTLYTVKVPDLALYSMARSLYEEYLGSQRRLLQTEIAAQAERNINSLFRFNELEKYGELLTRYPVLLQYLALPKP